MKTIRVSVRNLVEFLMKSGDLDNRRGGMADKEAMQLGSRLHRKIQARMGGSYQAEVPMKYQKECISPAGPYLLSVEGRADGVITEEDGITIDEIKGVYRSLDRIEEPSPVHVAQAKSYAYFYGKEKGRSSMKVQMTYCNLETEEVKRFVFSYSMEELEEWFEGLLSQYQEWCSMDLAWKEQRQASIGPVRFPFPYREGQKELAAAVYRTIARKKKLFIQAPTGVGKTISTVFPAVKAVGEGLGDKIFYLTAKTITRQVAWEAFQLLKKQGLNIKVIVLTAKEKICPLEETDCNPVHCPYAKGHFDRINQAVFEMLNETTDFSREDILSQADKFQVCPFELSLDLATWMDAIICDYNYVFDPTAHLKRFFGEGVKGDYLFLIDEAHNLVERGREMYSASLYKEDFLEIKRLLKEKDTRFKKALERCNRYLLEQKRECENYKLLKSLKTFPMSLMNLSGLLEDYLEEAALGEERKKILEFYFGVQNFLDAYERMDEGYQIYCELLEDGRFLLKLFCIDPSRDLKYYEAKGNSTVFFSATFLPITYYMGLLGGEKDDYAVYADTPFDPEQRAVILGVDVSSRYRRRGPLEYQKIASYIVRALEGRKGNYMVFFPSYRMLEDVLEAFEEQKPEGVRLLVQRSGMEEQEKEAFLSAFEEESEGLVGFCVMGGIFGEGIDLKGERLIGAVIVGTGLPMVCNEREILKQYFDGRNMDGFAYAYRIPGMNKVLQSAGRVIRTTEDRGVILLLDERFYSQEYYDLFPREWKNLSVCTLKDVGATLREFWKIPIES